MDPSEGPVKAEHAYIGIFHKLCQQYAKSFFEHWLIISAKHGLLLPSDMVPKNYNLSFHHKSADIITAKRLVSQIISKEIPSHDIVVLTGKKYKPIIYQAFPQANRIQFPLLGTKGIGEMQKLLKNSINHHYPLHQRSLKE